MKTISKITIVTLCICLLGVTTSCTKDPVENTNKYNPVALIKKQLASSKPADFYVNLISDHVFTRYTGINNSGGYTISAYAETGNATGNLLINNSIIPIDPNGKVFFQDNSSDTIGVNQVFGNYISIQLKSSSIVNNFAIKHYTPKIIRPILSSYSSINSKNSLSIQWDVDKNVLNNPVVILLEYDPERSGNENIRSQYPKPAQKSFIFDEKDGGCIISSSDLSLFPFGSCINLYIARGNEKDFDINGKTVRVLGLSISTVQKLKLN